MESVLSTNYVENWFPFYFSFPSVDEFTLKLKYLKKGAKNAPGFGAKIQINLACFARILMWDIFKPLWFQ